MQIKDYIPYKIKTGDTLKSLAIRIGLYNYKQLLHFHNKVCPEIESLKTEKLFKGNIIYIPTTQEINLLNKITKSKPTEQTSSIKLQLKSLNASYNIEIIKESINVDTKKKNVIAYTIDLKHLESTKKDNILIIDKNKFLINKKQPETKMQRLALQCSKSYYPMHLIVNKDGEIVGIENTPEIKERWLKNKANIENLFSGHYAEKYIDNVNYKILNTNLLEEAIRNDLILNTLLLPYKRENRITETTFNSTFFKYKIHFKIIQNTEIDNEKQDLVITQEGAIDDRRSYKELLAPESYFNNPFFMKLAKIEGALNNTFIIDLERGISKKIKASYKVVYTPIKSKITTININLINN